MLLCGTRWYMLQSHDLFNFRKGSVMRVGAGVGVERGVVGHVMGAGGLWRAGGGTLVDAGGT